MAVVVVATITPLPEHHADVLAAFRDAVPAVHAEDGCLLYALHERDGRIVMVEQWASQDALDEHLGAAALQRLGPQIKGRLAGEVDIVVLDPVPSGADDKGRLRA